jgi:hypothetical protein
MLMQDTITVTDLALAAYEQAHQPKKLVLLPGAISIPISGSSRLRARRPSLGSANTLGPVRK